jgi:hypothetical protein
MVNIVTTRAPTPRFSIKVITTQCLLWQDNPFNSSYQDRDHEQLQLLHISFLGIKIEPASVSP